MKKMEKKEFINVVKEALKAVGFDMEYIHMVKADYEYDGLRMKPTTGTTSSFATVVVNLDMFYEDYVGGEDLYSVLSKIDKMLRGEIEQPKVNVSDLTWLDNYEEVKKKLFLEVVAVDNNEEFLSDKVHAIVAENLVLVVKVLISCSPDTESIISAFVGMKMLERYNISSEQLMHDAMQSAPTIMPAFVMPLHDTLLGLIEEMSTEEKELFASLGSEKLDSGLVVVTTNGPGKYGASLFYPGVLPSLYIKYGDFYVIPSSKAEFLVLPVSKCACRNEKELLDMVYQVNSTELLPEEKLADALYKYDGISLKRVFS